MAKRVLGIDLGSYSVKIIRLDCGRQSFKFSLLDCEEILLPLEPYENRDETNLKKNILLELKTRGVLDAEIVATDFGASGGQMRIMKTPFNESRKIEAVLSGLLETELPFEASAMVMSWHRLIEASNDKDVSDELKSDIRIAFAKKEVIAESLEILQAALIDPRFLYLASLVTYEMVRQLGISEFVSDECPNGPSAIIDFGHTSTNLCIFDNHGIRFSRSLMLGGKKLTEDVARALSISFEEAQNLKHNQVDLVGEVDDIINRIARDHYIKIFDEINRLLIALNTSDNIELKTLTMVGGASLAHGMIPFSQNLLTPLGVTVTSDRLAKFGINNQFAVAFSLALSCLQIHAKHSRFNFRKDEFIWRGGLDSLRARSNQLVLWSLVIICSFVILWSTISMVLKKENDDLNKRLKQVCTEILGQPATSHKKCLSAMQEQINTSAEVSIPEYTASDIYLKLSEVIPKELHAVITELDVNEKKIRINAEVPSFEDVDVILSHLAKIPCLTSFEKGNAQKKDKVVKVSFSADLECNPKPTTKQEPAKRSMSKAI